MGIKEKRELAEEQTVAYSGRLLLSLREELEMFVRRSIMFVVICFLGRCTTRSSSSQWVFLLESAPLAFA